MSHVGVCGYRYRSVVIGVILATLGEFVTAACAQELTVSPNLANNLKYVQVGVKQGRIHASSAFAGRNLNSSTQSNDRREQLSLDLTGGAPSINYELSTATFRIVLQMTRGDTVRIQRSPVGDSTVRPLEFQQPAEGKVSVKIGTAEKERIITADSIWHLFAAEPELARTEIEPLLRLLKPGWPLMLTSQGIEQALYRQVDSQRRYDRDAWGTLVEQLRSNKYADRIEADRRLRELGQIVIPYLRSLDPKQLDAEQAFRIRMIVRSYGTEREEDAAETAADWLAADPEMWYVLAARSAGPQRAKARTQLSQILAEPVILDDEAKDDQLKAQLAKLREQIERLQRSSK
jgi:hypothetical protein